MKDVVALGDLHCGSVAGLTPPGWQVNPKRYPHISQLQKEMWKHWLKWTRKYNRPDLLIANGDLIDGSSKRNISELIVNDRDEQCAMAVKCLKMFNPKKVVITYGTTYHTSSDGEDYERSIAHSLQSAGIKTEIHNHAFIDVEGVMFDCKHHVSSSSVPHGRSTAVKRARLWNLIWASVGNQPVADIVLRSHVHYHDYSGSVDYLAMTLPALQAAHTKYGARVCEGLVDWGIVHFNITKGKYSWEPITARLEAEKVRIVKA